MSEAPEVYDAGHVCQEVYWGKWRGPEKLVDAARIAELTARAEKAEAEHTETLSRLAGSVAEAIEQRARAEKAEAQVQIEHGEKLVLAADLLAEKLAHGKTKARAEKAEAECQAATTLALECKADLRDTQALLDRAVEALGLAQEALADLGACDDGNCRLGGCNRALPTVRATLAAIKEAQNGCA